MYTGSENMKKKLLIVLIIIISIFGILKYKNYEDALKLGIASASATVNNVFLGTKDEINEYFNSF